MNQHASREEIIAALRQGGSDRAVGRELRCDKRRVARIRAELGMPVHAQPEQARTIEEKWRAFTRPIDGGHLGWAGERGTSTGTPILSYKGKRHPAAAVAFHIRTGRDPVGYVYAECEVRHCVSPQCVDDEAGRTRTREQLRYLTGGRERPARCVHGHDQAVHGRYETDGVAYCEACKVIRKRAGRAVAS